MEVSFEYLFSRYLINVTLVLFINYFPTYKYVVFTCTYLVECNRVTVTDVLKAQVHSRAIIYVYIVTFSKTS